MDTLKVATWNVRGVASNEHELAKILNVKKIDIAVITETKKKLKGSKYTEDYLMLYKVLTKGFEL